MAVIVITLPMKTRILHTKIYKDKFFASLSLTEKFLFIYFLTNGEVNIIHLYELPEHVILFETGVSKEELEQAKSKFQFNKKLYFFDDFVYIANAQRYENYSGKTNEEAKSKLYALLPKSVLDWFYSISDTPIYTPQIPPINKKQEIINPNKKKEINKERDEEVDIDELPETLGRN